MNYQEYKNELMEFLKKMPSKDEIINFINKYQEQYPKYRFSIIKGAFSVMKDSYTIVAIDLIEPYLEDIKDVKLLNVIRKRYKRLGMPTERIDDLIKKRMKLQLVDDLENKFKESLKDKGLKYSLDELNKYFEKYPFIERTLLKRIFKILKDIYPQEAKEIARKVKEKFGDSLSI